MNKQEVLALRRACTAYRGYSITKSPFDDLYRVSKDGFNICTAESMEAARAAVDEVTR